MYRKKYIRLVPNKNITVFKFANTDYCDLEGDLETYQIDVYRMGCDKVELSQNPYKIVDNEFYFVWCSDFYSLAPGWYRFVFLHNCCRVCGDFTVKLGSDCCLAYKETLDRVIAECDNGEDLAIDYCKKGPCICHEPCFNWGDCGRTAPQQAEALDPIGAWMNV